MTKNESTPERPRVEPEIIPPDRYQRGPTWQRTEFPDMGGTSRVYVSRFGPFAGILVVLALVVLAIVILLAFVGALLFWIPVVALIAIGAALFGLLGPRRR